MTATNLSRRSFVAAASTAVALGAVATETRSFAAEASSDAAETSEAAPDAASETPAPAWGVEVYDFGTVKVHAFNTHDPLGDVCYLVEGSDAIVGIELPPLVDSLKTWKAYADSLGKPFQSIFVDAHPAGSDFIEGMKIYGTQGASDAIESGSTRATSDGLADTFGAAWDSNYVEITDVVSDGPVTVDGIDFVVNDRRDTYDLVVVDANAVSTHMLGGTVHSILASTDAIDEMIATLQGYLDAGYTLMLPAHTMPEGMDAVSAKIVYLQTAKEIAAQVTTADEFIARMTEAFPDYAGQNYLEMSAGMLFPQA